MLNIIKNITDKIDSNTLTIEDKEDFINNHNIRVLSWTTQLPESFIEAFEDYISWSGVSANTDYISESFIIKHRDKIDLNKVIFTRCLSSTFVEDNINYIIKEKLDLINLKFYQSHLGNELFEKIEMIMELGK